MRLHPWMYSAFCLSSRKIALKIRIWRIFSRRLCKFWKIPRRVARDGSFWSSRVPVGILSSCQETYYNVSATKMTNSIRDSMKHPQLVFQFRLILLTTPCFCICTKRPSNVSQRQMTLCTLSRDLTCCGCLFTCPQRRTIFFLFFLFQHLSIGAYALQHPFGLNIFISFPAFSFLWF